MGPTGVPAGAVRGGGRVAGRLGLLLVAVALPWLVAPSPLDAQALGAVMGVVLDEEDQRREVCRVVLQTVILRPVESGMWPLETPVFALQELCEI